MDGPGLHPSLQKPLELLRLELHQLGIDSVVVETVRSPERQMQLYAQGRTVKGQIVTHAKPYESAHQWGLAIDVKPVPATARNWAMLRHHASRLGFRLLGEWDPGHLEHPQWPQVLAYLRRARIV